MANLLLFSTRIIFFLIFIYQSISIRILYLDELIFEFYIIFFVFRIRPSRKNKKKKRKLGHYLKSIIPLKKSLEFMLSGANITVYHIDVKLNTENPSFTVIQSQTIFSFISFILAYITMKAKTITYQNSDFYSSKNLIDDKFAPTIDISLDTSFSVFFLTGIIFLFEIIKKRGKKLVGG